MFDARSPNPPVTPTMRVRSIAAAGVVALALVLLIGRAFYIQVLRGDEYAAAAKKQSIRVETIAGERGRILDASGGILACDVPAYSVWLYTPDAGDVQQTLEILSRRVKFDVEAVRRRIRNGGLFVPVERGISVDVGHALMDERIAGVHLLPDQRRVYPLGEAAAALVGAVGFEGHGLNGVEAAYEELLAGRPGRIVTERDGANRLVRVEVKPDGRPLPGKDLHLTVRAGIQEAAFRALEKARSEFKARAASAVVIDAQDGRVLALVCTPSFDPADPGKAHPDAIRLRPVSDAFEPGSSFKPFVMAAALELGIVSLDEQWHCGNGAWRFQGRLLHDAHPYAMLDTWMVVVKSSNIGMAKVGLRINEKLGYKGFHEIVSAFGFGRPTGVGLPGETPGLLLPHTQWTSYSVTSIPMGQEIAVSPLQLSLGYAALVNGGWLHSPRLVDRWEKGPYREALGHPGKPARVISQDVSDTMRVMLERVVTEGTGKKAQLKEYRVGGKTGTAQKAEGGVYVDGKYVGSFVGFAPADAPRVVCTVFVDEPGDKYYGGTVAAPAVREILQASMLDLGVPPSPAAASPARSR